MPLLPAGQPISSSDAQLYMNKYATVKKALKDKVLSKITVGDMNSDVDLKDCVTNFYADENAFFFSRDMLDRFFNPTDPDAPVASYLVIFLGTKFKRSDSDMGQPTIVIAGVNPHPTIVDTYVSLDIPLPADEQPPRKTLTTFPVPKVAGGFGDIEFKIL